MEIGKSSLLWILAKNIQGKDSQKITWNFLKKLSQKMKNKIGNGANKIVIEFIGFKSCKGCGLLFTSTELIIRVTLINKDVRNFIFCSCECIEAFKYNQILPNVELRI